MKIAAITTEGAEFMYTRASAHKVSAENAERICNALNENRYKLDPSEPFRKWKVYSIDKSNPVMHIASEQSFTIRNGYLYEKGARNFF